MRIKKHPVLDIPEDNPVSFTWNGEKMTGQKGEMISSALFANNVKIFGHHYKDESPQGLFCANGQCSQCMVIADGLPVKGCMTPLKENIEIKSVEGLPELPDVTSSAECNPVPIEETEVLIIGAGPAGLSAAIELGKLGIQTLVIDDKDRVGGKLVLQTHKFFGSVKDSYAGTRGYKIADILKEEIDQLESVTIWLNTTAAGVFSDKIVGVVKENKYIKIKPQKLLIATGAREKMLSFPGNTLPGVYGAGAFQTLVNRDLIKASEKILIVGGGNVGLIAGYHALQAGIEVVALVEAAPEIGGYKVHADKLERMGVPLLTNSTIVSANGKEHLESVTISEINENWQIIPGTKKTYEVDTLLIAVGLSEVNEFYLKAIAWGMDAYSAGDAKEIAEASAAMFSGRIEGLEIARSLGHSEKEIPDDWHKKLEILKSRPGNIYSEDRHPEFTGVTPVFHCTQEIPCNPCISVCPENLIKTENDQIMGLPYITEAEKCKGCMNCVAVCPGLAITMVDFRKDAELPTVTIAHEIEIDGEEITVTDKEGKELGQYKTEKVLKPKKYPGTSLVQIKVEKEKAFEIAGVKVSEEALFIADEYESLPIMDDAVICRCERVTAGEIRKAIREGVRDINHLKALNRAGMGACGSKTCKTMIWRIFKEEGIDFDKVTDRVDRPLFVEIPMGTLAGVKDDE